MKSGITVLIAAFGASVVISLRTVLSGKRIPIELGGKLLLILTRNVKYVEISPTPEVLPKDIIRDAQVVS